MAQKRQDKVPIADSWEDEDLEDTGDDNKDFQKSVSANAIPSSQIAESSAGDPILSPSDDGRPLLSISSPKAISSSSPPMSPPEPPSPPPNTRAVNSPAPQSQARSTRPETVSGPAARMIASALGVKPAPRTPEQRAYDKAIKEKEIRRKNEEKEKAKHEAAERERLKKEMWDD